MDSLKVKNFGPIKEANVEFGDLTILVGPQASGKSLFLQLLKLAEDKDYIARTLQQYSYVWNGSFEQNLDLFFGEDMAGAWRPNTEVVSFSKKVTKSFLTQRIPVPERDEFVFYIPAQRILCLPDGRLRAFEEFDIAHPFVLKYFSEKVRQMQQHDKLTQDTVFPARLRLKEPVRDSINDSIFHNGIISFQTIRGQNKLKMQVDGMNIPFTTWSTGQKEFMPLLLAFYWLSVATKRPRRDDISYIIIEEPEMGLHPQAIKSVILQVIDLMSRDYKVILSTHSPVILEFAWAFQFLKESNAKIDALYELFEMPKIKPMHRLFENTFKKTINTYYFNNKSGAVFAENISSLDAGSLNDDIAEWGGISSFASRAGEIVSKNVPL